MRSSSQVLGFSMATLMLAVITIMPAHAADKSQTFTGQVSDAMCGVQHMMEGSAADCTRACIKKGSKYALVVGDKAYTLETSDKAALVQLDKLAGAKATVTGNAAGDTIEVTSVAPGK